MHITHIYVSSKFDLGTCLTSFHVGMMANKKLKAVPAAKSPYEDSYQVPKSPNL